MGMPYQVLARKYRPQRFGDVAGQDHVTRTLQNALEQGRIAHGYIFSGHRGIGKTTIARILAAALNCQRAIGSTERPTPEPCGTCDSCREIRAGNAVDVIEIDAATNRGIDEIRELRDAARYRPARDRYKIYILDEAHQITDAAFNALLKTLEEPPEHIVFMMATTEPENIPQTIRSRCQHFSFHAVKLDDILTELRGIAAHEGILADEAALALLAEAGDGSMRDALSIMDQAIASAPVIDGKAELSAGEIRDLMGTVPNTVFEEVLESVARGDAAAVLSTLGRLLDAGNSSSQIARQCVRYLRNCVMAKISGLTEEQNTSDLLQVSPDERRRAVRSAMLFTEEELARFLQVMLRTFDDLGFRQEQRLHLELGLLKLVHLQRLVPMQHFLSQLPKSSAAVSRPIPAPRAAAPLPIRPPATTAAPTRFSPLSTNPSSVTIKDPRHDEQSWQPDILIQQSARSAGAVEPQPVPNLVAPSTLPPVATPSGAREDASQPTVSPQPVSLSIDAAEPAPSSAVSSPPPAAEGVLSELTAAEEPTSPPPADPEATEPATQTESGAAAALQAAAVEALFATGKHTSAAEQLETSTWALQEGAVRIATSLSKPMLPMIFRADVEAIIKSALRDGGLPGARLIFEAGAADNKPKTPKKPRTGSAQARALEHPTVQAAQKLFNAEITNVFDLRKD